MNTKPLLAIPVGVIGWQTAWGKMLTDGLMDVFAHPAQHYLSQQNPQHFYNIVNLVVGQAEITITQLGGMDTLSWHRTRLS